MTNHETADPPATNQAAEAEAPLSPDYEHPECGFHWHGCDGMDIPMRDGQPVCPRCELRRVEKLLAHRERRCEELRAESKRRGKVKLEYAEKIRLLERQIDEVRRQLGAEILRAGQAEAELAAAVSVPPPATRADTLTAVRALHQPMQRGPFTICAHCSGWDGEWRCLGVVTDYPCPTLRALDGEPQPGGPCVAGEQQNETPDDGPLLCPRCGTDISDYGEDDFVFRTGDERPYCSGECIVAAHRAALSTAPAVVAQPGKETQT